MVINDIDMNTGPSVKMICRCCGKVFYKSHSLVEMMKDEDGEYVQLLCDECFDSQQKRTLLDEQRKWKEHIVDFRLSSMNLAEEDRNASFDSFDPHTDRLKDAMEYAKAFVINEDWVFGMIGKTGNGKTHLAVSMLREWCTCDNPNCMYITEKELFDEIVGTIRSKTVSAEDVVLKYSGYDQLVIDEIGRNEVSDFKRENFLAIMMRRLNKRRKTVLIGNITADAFREYFPDAVISRMGEGGRSFVFTEEDYRKRRRS